MRPDKPTRTDTRGPCQAHGDQLCSLAGTNVETGNQSRFSGPSGSCLNDAAITEQFVPVDRARAKHLLRIGVIYVSAHMELVTDIVRLQLVEGNGHCFVC